MPSARSSCAAACTSARLANAPAAQAPLPGIARLEEPPVTWINAPPPPPAARSAAAPVERNTKHCSATATAHPRNASRLASARGPPPNGPPEGGRLAPTALTTASSAPDSSLACARGDALERLIAAGDRRHVPSPLAEVIDDRAAEVARSQHDDGPGHGSLLARGHPKALMARATTSPTVTRAVK